MAERGYPNLKKVISQFSNMQILDKNIIYDDKWSKNRGRIYIELPYSLNNEKMYEYTQEFIVKTIDKIHQEING